MTNSNKHLKLAAALLSLFFLLITISGCSLDRSGKKPPQDCQGNEAGMVLKLTVRGLTGQANESYQTSVTWQAEIVNPDSQNTCGNILPFSITKTYSGNRNVSGDYFIEQPSTGQRPGEWKFTMISMNESASCNKILTPGDTKLVHFTHGQSGCE